MNHNNFSERMYREHILELYRNPSNFGKMKNPTKKHTEHNSFCGDEITFYLKIKDGRIKDASFEGSGCVLSVVSSSMLAEKIRNMNISDVKKFGKKDLIDLLKIKISLARLKCVLLQLNAVAGALEKNA